MYLATDNETKENAKWGVVGTTISSSFMEYPMSGFIPMSEYLTPGIGGHDFAEPKMFDTKEEAMQWMEKLKKEFSSIIPL